MTGEIASLLALTPTTERIALTAGPWTLCFEAGDLRSIACGEQEVVSRIYGAVRNEKWTTIPATISDLRTRVEADGFGIAYTATHRDQKVHFVWQAEITGQPDGTVRFNFDGEARSAFLRNRIGLCVLHPMSAAGSRCRVERQGGSQAELRLPERVDPAQPIPGISDLKTFAHEFAPERWACLEFEGERFEMEDQRNWIDASFKIYGTPLSLPYPVTVVPGTRIQQLVTLSWAGPRRPHPVQVTAREVPVLIQIGEALHPLPEIGVSVATHAQPLGAREIECLRALSLRHLRVDVLLGDSTWLVELRRACVEASALSLPLELAIHVPPDAGERELVRLRELIADLAQPIRRVLVFSDGAPTATGQTHALVRTQLAKFGVPIGAGTNADFYQLNQDRPPDAQADFVHWSMNPQVHATDLTSLAQTPSAIVAQLHSATAYFPGKPRVISSLALKPRDHPGVMAQTDPSDTGALPASVDVRQVTPFAAAWTLAALKYLAEGEAESVTLFETTGWRGVMESEPRSTPVALFPAQSGQLYPLYHAIAAATRPENVSVVSTRSTEASRVDAIGFKTKGGISVFVVNLTGEPQRVRILGGGRLAAAQKIDWTQPDGWMFRRDPILHDCDVELRLDVPGDVVAALPPFAFVRVNFCQ